LPQEVKDGLEIVYVRYIIFADLRGLSLLTMMLRSHVWESIRLVWPEVQWPGEHLAGIQSQL